MTICMWSGQLGCSYQTEGRNGAGEDEANSEKIFVEETRIIHVLNGEKAGDEFGWVARIIGDVDDDNVIDFVTTAPSFGNGRGKIYVYSTKSAKLLYEVEGDGRERLGNGAAGAGDVNGDSVPDVIAGAPNGKQGGKAYVYSGKDGEVLLTLGGPKTSGQFGYKVSSLGDVDGDGFGDVIVGAIAANGKQAKSGAAYAFSGQSGKMLFQLDGERSGDKFGSAIAAIQKGEHHLIAVGAQDAGENKGGCVYIYQVNDGAATLAFQIKGDTKSANLGQMFVSFPGDVNQDGVPDVYASDFNDSTANRGAGKIVVHSGADGSQLYAVTGKQPGEGFGTSPSDAGDVNGDGIGDLVVGAWQHRSGAPSGGQVTLLNGADGKKMDAWTCQVQGDTFGFDAVGIGDVDGDDQVDFLLTSAWAEINGPKTGRVFVIAGKDYASLQTHD